jgi:hypothetical protein
MSTEEIKQPTSPMEAPDAAGALSRWSPSPGRCHSGIVFHLIRISCGRWPLEKHGVLLDMVGQVGRGLSLSPRDAGICSPRVRSTANARYRAYRILNHGILLMIVVFFLFGDRITWANCLTGIAGRTWLLVCGLPAWLTALRPHTK